MVFRNNTGLGKGWSKLGQAARCNLSVITRDICLFLIFIIEYKEMFEFKKHLNFICF